VRLARKPQNPHTLRLVRSSIFCPECALRKRSSAPAHFPPLRARRLNCTLSCTVFQSMRSANLTLYLFVASGTDIMRVNAGF
jgi:hypothetical protein